MCTCSVPVSLSLPLCPRFHLTLSISPPFMFYLVQALPCVGSSVLLRIYPSLSLPGFFLSRSLSFVLAVSSSSVHLSLMFSPFLFVSLHNLSLYLSLSFPVWREGHSNKVSISPTDMPLGWCWQNFITCKSSSGKQSIRSCTWRHVMIERAMWIASGGHGGLVLERDAPEG